MDEKVAEEFVPIKGKQKKKYNLMIYGTPGIGKTTLASQAHKSIVCDLENGSSHVDCERQQIDSWPQLLKFITWVSTQDYDTIIFDSYTKLEKIMTEQICRENNWPNLEKPGFGKGYQVLKSYAQKFINGLSFLNEKGKNTITIAHGRVKTVLDPMNESFDRYEPDMHKESVILFHSHMDFIFFYKWKYLVKETEKGDGRYIAKTAGDRELYTVERATFLAKSRKPLDVCYVNPKEDFINDVCSK